METFDQKYSNEPMYNGSVPSLNLAKTEHIQSLCHILLCVECSPWPIYLGMM